MTPERLDEIRQAAAKDRGTTYSEPNEAAVHRGELLAEVDRLRAALKEVGVMMDRMAEEAVTNLRAYIGTAGMGFVPEHTVKIQRKVETEL